MSVRTRWFIRSQTGPHEPPCFCCDSGHYTCGIIYLLWDGDHSVSHNVAARAVKPAGDTGSRCCKNSNMDSSCSHIYPVDRVNVKLKHLHFFRCCLQVWLIKISILFDNLDSVLRTFFALLSLVASHGSVLPPCFWTHLVCELPSAACLFERRRFGPDGSRLE